MHDFGKIFEYAVTFGGPPERLQIIDARRYAESVFLSHIVWGLMYWARFADRLNYSPGGRLATEVAHAIAAHHGRKEWGSPVTPQCRVAVVLHQADMHSVFEDCGRFPA